MHIFVTSDLHLGHKNIIKYCNRPYSSLEEHNQKIIYNWNQRIKKTDVVFHLWDFYFKGGYEGSKLNALEYIEQLNGRITFIKGNHDKTNRLKEAINCCIINFAKLNIFMLHNINNKKTVIPDNIDLILCGHVHNSWKYIYLNKILAINVGVDVWNYKPTKLIEIINYCNKNKLFIQKENKHD